jgi:nitrogen fixation protein NifB
MSAIDPETVMRLYSWAEINSNRLRGEKMGRIIPELQLSGIRTASDHGINVKVNSILIPEINQTELFDLARKIREAGAGLQNITPLVPRGSMAELSTPSKSNLIRIRRRASKIIPQFNHCKQCRSDVVGIPGCDRVLT